MTQPAGPPATIGLAPTSAFEVNQQVGLHLKNFVDVKNTIGQDREWLAGADLKVDPYYFDADQETQIKTAVLQLDEALDQVDMTFINRLIGLHG